MLIYKTVHLTEVFDQTSFLFSFIRKNGCIKFKTFSKSYILIEEFFSVFFNWKRFQFKFYDIHVLEQNVN